ncbi:MAG: GNAT family N-acetyltransferase [Cyanobacteria bacterium J06607_6]
MSDLSTSSAITIGFATPEDVPAIVRLIHALADYEKLAHEVTGNAADLTQHLFGDHAHIETLIARVDDIPVGFALFFHNYSTFLMKPGIYLEDLFVAPEYRGRGIGKLLLQRLGQLALERDCGRLEWNVLDWNQPAIDFYERMGAEIKPEWQLCRVTGSALTELASS